MDKDMFQDTVACSWAKHIEEIVKNALGPIMFRQLNEEIDHTISNRVFAAMSHAYEEGYKEAEYRALVIRSDEAASRKDAFLKALLSDEAKAMTKEQRELYALKAFAGVDVTVMSCTS